MGRVAFAAGECEGRNNMSDAASDPNPLRAFVRGTWILLIVQLVVALFVFGALTYASMQLSGVLRQIAEKQAEVRALETQEGVLRRRLVDAISAIPHIRGGVDFYHTGLSREQTQRYQQALDAYEEAIHRYQQALLLVRDDPYVLDLMSYSQYMAGRMADRTSQTELGGRHFEGAVASIRQSLQTEPRNIGGYVELAIYECARGRYDAGVAAFEEALSREPTARDMFMGRLAEIPSRCTSLRDRLVQ